MKNNEWKYSASFNKEIAKKDYGTGKSMSIHATCKGDNWDEVYKELTGKIAEDMDKLLKSKPTASGASFTGGLDIPKANHPKHVELCNKPLKQVNGEWVCTNTECQKL